MAALIAAATKFRLVASGREPQIVEERTFLVGEVIGGDAILVAECLEPGHSALIDDGRITVILFDNQYDVGGSSS